MLNIDSSRPTLLCLVVVIVGFFIGSRGEMNFSMKGTVSGILASLFISLNSIYTKKALTVVDNDHWKLTFYNNANACILFIPLMLIFEYQAIGMAFFEQFLSMTFWGAMWIAGFFGFAIGIVTVLQIKATSPLTHHIIGSAKAAIQSILAFYIWGNPATFLGCLGIATVLGGSLLYTYVKMEEGRQPTPPSPPAHADKDVEMNNPLLKGGPN
jgi:solute carrier family 35 (GDP-fucose transporter), member C1